MKRIVLTAMAILPFACGFSQSTFSGDLELNTQFYQRDSLIGASGTPHYDNLLSGGDAWMNVYYMNAQAGLDAGIRLDVFNNSDLHNPGTPYTDEGIGRWYISKKLNLGNQDNLEITGGYIYDQFATGLVFRSYEERPLGIDNALFGFELQANLGENWTIRAIGGQQKDLFTRYPEVLKGAAIDGNLPLKNPSLTIAPGICYVNRTLNADDINIIAAQINTYALEKRFVPKYNMYAGSVYNTFAYKDISWYVEYAVKSHEAIKGADGSYVDKPGNVLYSSLTYSTSKIGHGFGITGQFRKVNDWVMRVNPELALLNGEIDYLPSITQQNSLRLTARYAAVAQELGETGFQINATFSPDKVTVLNGDYSEVRNPENLLLFREAIADYELRKPKFKMILGGQYVLYDQEVFENHPGVPVVKAITPFSEFTFKITRKKSLRFELQYQDCHEDYGSWVYGLAEYNIAPRWSFAASDMWNYDPLKTEKALHYYSLFASYTIHSTRITVNYVKQIGGIVCTGGVCRYEPAFSGFKAGILTTF